MESKSLTLRQAAGIVVVDACFCLLFAWWGYNALQANDKLLELISCVAASTDFLLLPFFVWNFFRVKKGISVMVRHKPSPSTPQVAFRNLCIIAYLWTLAIVAATNLLARDFTTVKTLEERLSTVAFGVALWLLHGLGWLWVLSQRPSPPIAAQEQPEGVWPPAPSVPDGRSKTDGNLQ